MHSFRYYFTPLSGYFSPFPHGTSSLSVIGVYLALEDGPPSFLRNSTCSVVLGTLEGRHIFFVYGAITLYGSSFQNNLTKNVLCNFPIVRYYDHRYPTTPTCQRISPIRQIRFRLLPVRSPLLGQSLLFSFPDGTKMFQFPSCAFHNLCIQLWIYLAV